MNAVLSCPVQRACRTFPVCPTGTRGRIFRRRISYANHAAQSRAIEERGEKDRLQNHFSLPQIPRVNTALSFAPPLPSPPYPTGSTTTPGPETPTDNNSYVHPHRLPSGITHLLRAIDSRSPESIWHHFTQLTPHERHLLTPQHLSHILLSLRPKHHLPLSARAYLDHYHPSYTPSTSSIPLARLPKRQHAVNWLMSRVTAVLEEYRANSIPLGTAEYAHLLDIARAKGDVRMAKELWAEMDVRGVRRDTKCYNTYIAALCGSTLTEGTWKTNARTVQVRARRGCGVRGKEEEKVGDVGAVALRIWDMMLKDGCVPDMATFEFVLGAVARMGNLPVVKALIWRCWGVDISKRSFDTPPATPAEINEPEPDLHSATSKKSFPPVGQFTPNHPPPPPPPPPLPPSEPPPLHLRPTPQTLTTLATTISRLSHPSIAIRLINHLSIAYFLTIPTSTWQQLLVWTYVYTRPPARTRVLPEAAMSGLWQVMREPPYSVTPDIEMYDLIIRHHLRGQRYRWAKQLITEALAPGGAWERLNNQFKATRLRVEREVGWGVTRSRGISSSGERRKSLPHLNQTTPLTTSLAALDLKIYRTRSLTSRWIQLLIYAPYVDDTPQKDFRRREVPILINRYAKEFLPAEVGYKIEGAGYVTIRAQEGVLGMEEVRGYEWPVGERKVVVDVEMDEEKGEKVAQEEEEENGEDIFEEEEENEEDGEEEDTYETQEHIDLVPPLGSGVERRFLGIHRQRESVRWRWKNRGVKYGEWRGEGSGYAKGEGGEAQGGEGVLGVDRTQLGPPERSIRLGFVRRR